MKPKNNDYIAIPAFLKIEAGALERIGSFFRESDIHKVVLFFGNGLIKMFKTTIIHSLQANNIEVLTYQELDSVRFEDVTNLALNLPNETQAVIGIGGGKVIDAAKYCGFLRKLPFISVPTSASSDGFSSSSASLIIDGKRKSVPAKMPYGIVADTEIIKNAPKPFLYSGIGDMVSKITALYDWQYEEDMGYTEVDDFAMMVAKKAVNSFVRTPFGNILDDLFLRELLNSLAMSGVANEIAGNSAPTSGSEHLISHALDQILETPQLHGVQVGIATYLMCLVQNHRTERITNFFTHTGFFDHAQSLHLNIEDYEKAIDLAPAIKPFRHTFLHEEEHRKQAKKRLYQDVIMRGIFHI